MPDPIPEKLLEALPGLLPSFDRNRPDVSKLAGDASNRQYFRVAVKDTSYVAMKLADIGPNSLAEEITKTSRKITELPFLDVARYLKKRGVQVPSIMGYDEPRGVILLEDFGDRLLVDAAAQANENDQEVLYKRALTELEKIAWIDPHAPRDSIAFARSFDRELYHWEFVHFVEYGVDKRLKKPPMGGERDQLIAALDRLIDEYLSWDQVFCHRDYHSRNLIVLENSDRFGVIDFQDALLAPLFYDLASLLRDSYITLGSALCDRLVEAYRQQMKGYHFRLTDSKEAFLRAFDIMALHRNLKAAGRFCYIDEVKRNPRYLADVPRTLTYVEETLKRHSDLRDLRERLLPHLAEISEACRQ